MGVSKGGTHEVGGSKTQGSALDDPGVPEKKVPAFLYMIPLERWNVERKFILRAVSSMEREYSGTAYSVDLLFARWNCMLAYVPDSVERKLQADPGRLLDPARQAKIRLKVGNFSSLGQAVTCWVRL